MDHRLGNLLRLAKATENSQHFGNIFAAHQGVRRDGGHTGVNQRRRIRHRANDFAIVAKGARQLLKRNAGGDRDHQRLFIQAGGDIAQHFGHDPRFNRAEDDIGNLRHFLGAAGGVDAILVAQSCNLVRRRGVDPDLSRLYLTAGDQPAQNGLTHIAAADKANFLIHHHSPLLFSLRSD